MIANDHTGSQWLTLFNEAAIDFFGGRSAAELKEVEDDMDKFEELLAVHPHPALVASTKQHISLTFTSSCHQFPVTCSLSAAHV